jgi:hypothetical protein
MKPSIYIGGKYSNSPMRHRSENKKSFKDFLIEEGHNLTDVASNAEIFLALDHFKAEENLLLERKLEKKFSVLFRHEPRCVLPASYEVTTLELYSSVLAFGKSEASLEGLHWPQHWPITSKERWESNSRLTRVVAVNANKLNLNRYELYSLRRKCFKEIESIDFFGEDWNSSFRVRLKTLVIEIMKDPLRHLMNVNKHALDWFHPWSITLAPSEKLNVLKDYKISLVIENEISYMSEKLFDAFFAGCIPIYVGPDVTEFKIPKELVLQSPPTIGGIERAILEAERMDLLSHQAKLMEWLENESTKELHESSHVIERALSFVMREYENFEEIKSHRK